MMNKRIPNLFLEDAEVLPGSFRNFAGKAGRYTKEGERNFNIVLSPNSLTQYKIDNPPRPARFEDASMDDLIRDGWNLRLMKPRDDTDPDEPPRYKLNIKVSFPSERPDLHLPPLNVYLYSGRKKTLLDEESIATLDYAEYRTADLILRPRIWIDDKTGEQKVKAYLREMRVVIAEDHWAKKYADYDEE